VVSERFAKRVYPVKERNFVGGDLVVVLKLPLFICKLNGFFCGNVKGVCKGRKKGLSVC
jgi:hypothetical protein